jgi:uncharacterized protein (UPF0210 family)
MKIRSITAFIGEPTAEAIQNAAEGCQRMKETAQSAGWDVQSLRLATIPFSQWLPLLHAPSVAVHELEEEIQSAGFDYISLGSIPADDYAAASRIPEILQATVSTFCTQQLVKGGTVISNLAIQMAAKNILENSTADPNGFTNLRFGALANVPAGCPFFPAASSDSEVPGFAFAIEGADLAAETFSESTNSAQAAKSLTTRIETAANKLAELGENTHGAAFQGIDFTLAPSPEEFSSIGLALEKLGVTQFGQNGTLAACAFLMSIQDQCSYKRVGFNGLMLPVLEDTTLAERNSKGYYDINKLLLYSAVCGTGLDCIPLPGDVSPEQLEAILLDIAALSCRLRKPLTARLMPVPGKSIGEMTSFDFEFFANSRIMDSGDSGLKGYLKTDPELVIQPRIPQIK